jgi:hypothetical protein
MILTNFRRQFPTHLKISNFVSREVAFRLRNGKAIVHTKTVDGKLKDFFGIFAYSKYLHSIKMFPPKYWGYPSRPILELHVLIVPGCCNQYQKLKEVHIIWGNSPRTFTIAVRCLATKLHVSMLMCNNNVIFVQYLVQNWKSSLNEKVIHIFF